MKLTKRLAKGFEGWGNLVIRHRWVTIVAVVAFSAALIVQIPRATIDTSIEGWLHEDDPVLLAYADFRDQFMRDDRIVIAIRTRDVFSRDFLARLAALHRALENEVPGLDDLTSLINARNTRGEGDDLVVEELLGAWPLDDEGIAEVKARALANPLYRDLLLSEDARYTTVTLRIDTYGPSGNEGLDASGAASARREPSAAERRLLTDRESHSAVRAIRGILERYQGPDFETFMAGAPVLNERVTSGMQQDMRRFLGLVVFAVVLLLFVFFRSASAALLATGVVLLSLLSTLGLAPLLEIPLQVPTQILPALLLAVGIADSVHILAIFQQQLRSGRSREESITRALGHSGLPVVMTSITTAGALASLALAELKPISNLGVLAPIGIGFALFYSLTLLPAALTFVRVRPARVNERRTLALFDLLLVRCGEIAWRSPWKVVLISGAVLAICSAGALQLRFSSDPLRWLRQGDPLRVATQLIDRELHGAMTIEVLFDTGAENALHEPDLLRRFEEIEMWNAELRHGDIFVGKTLSLVDVLEEIHQALNENRPEYHAIPPDRQHVAQELLLFESAGSDDLREVADSLFSVARMTLKVPWEDAISYPPVLARLDEKYRETMGDQASVTITGLVPLMSRTFEAVVASMARSYGIAFLVVAPLMCILLGSFRAGLVSMIPNLAPIVVTLGVMGWFGFPLNAFTLLIGSLALGLAVDDTIHLLHAFARYYDETGDAQLAIRRALQTTGQALLFTTLVLCSGFAIFTLGSMRSTFNFGFLTSFTLAVAFIADVLLTPALVVLLTRMRTNPFAPRR